MKDDILHREDPEGSRRGNFNNGGGFHRYADGAYSKNQKPAKDFPALGPLETGYSSNGSPRQQGLYQWALRWEWEEDPGGGMSIR